MFPPTRLFPSLRDSPSPRIFRRTIEILLAEKIPESRPAFPVQIPKVPGSLVPAGWSVISSDLVKARAEDMWHLTLEIAKGNPTTKDVWIEFEYPGIASIVALSSTALDLSLAPRVSKRIKAQSVTSYQTSGTAPLLTNPLWAPNEWAQAATIWNPSLTQVNSVTKGIPGYRSAGAGGFLAGSINSSATPGSESYVMGEKICASGSGTIYLIGGPPDPAGTTWTIAQEIQEAFTDLNGVTTFEVTTITAMVPEQAPPPVNITGYAQKAFTLGATDALTKAAIKAIATAAGGMNGVATQPFILKQDGTIAERPTPGDVTMAKATLLAVPAGLANDTATLWKPNDYNGTTNKVAWLITTWT